MALQLNSVACLSRYSIQMIPERHEHLSRAEKPKLTDVMLFDRVELTSRDLVVRL